MFTPRTPRRGNQGRGRARGKGARSPAKTPLKGMFADGVWHCNCHPRLPAQRFQVKKESKNKGRWFYTCQKTEAKRCDFFLWEDDARFREEGAVLNNSRSEPWSGVDVTPSKPRSVIDITPSKPAQQRTQFEDGGFIRRDKRSRDEFEEDDDDEFGESFDAEALELMKQAAETPSKSRKVDALAIPKRRVLPWLRDQEGQKSAGGLLTPQTERVVKQGLFTTPTKETERTAASTTSTRGSITQPQLRHREPSPSPCTLKALDSMSTPVQLTEARSPSKDAPELTSDVLEYLRESKVQLPPPVQEGLKQLLSKHTFRTQGVIKGREISRLALKAKDAKIVELQHRIAALEADFEAERAQNRYRDWEVKTSSHND
ncbi:hypothetical protein EJ05DRAFT_71271 [Pseudovirgaria hyperparasitica]|uniref:GRF-type domain-containing protein n=1 Tax=Pseudovirgaria hyperparasitica TaxID=470096 RepID=A0A6A6W143_9PEZI|nr:uncharacterized protein EJ05DRAFT_71271 [Pseudovirgaria hyperparasitica]KAF2756638.1 hypothetical protein EJ05DRAFT_71271 [Pseudovirgaria hyperparasitica]